MDFRNEALAELARDAALERSDFLVRAGEQLERFIGANRERIRALGGIARQLGQRLVPEVHRVAS